MTEAGASTLTRRRLFAGGAGLAVATGALWATAGPASASGSGLSPADLAALYQLKVNYAVGTDLIAGGDLAGGRDLYRITFTGNAAVSGGFDRNHPDFLVHGPDELAQSVASQTAAAVATQHLLGTANIQPSGHGGNSATLTVYVQATVLAEQGKGLTRVLATYHDTAERRAKGWRLTSSFSQFVSVEAGERVAP